MSSGERFRALRQHLNISQTKMAEMVGVTRNTWQTYESGDLPKGDVLKRITDLGVSIDWLLTGRGTLYSPVPLTSPSPVGDHRITDADLLGRIIDGVLATYRSVGQYLAPVQQGRIVGPLYDELVMIAGEEARHGALQYALIKLKQDLEQAAIEPETTKHRA